MTSWDCPATRQEADDDVDDPADSWPEEWRQDDHQDGQQDVDQGGGQEHLAALLGGTLEASPDPDSGWTVHAVLPKIGVAT